MKVSISYVTGEKEVVEDLRYVGDNSVVLKMGMKDGSEKCATIANIVYWTKED